MIATNSSSTSFILPFLTIMIVFSTFSYDEYNKWDAYAITLPNGRKEIVKSKYVMTILLIVITSIISLIITIFSIIINKSEISMEQLILNTTLILFSILFIISILYPLIYKFGIEKGRIIIFLVFIAIGLFATLFFQMIGETNINNFINNINVNMLIYLMLMIIILIVFSSYKISLSIYLKKDF